MKPTPKYGLLNLLKVDYNSNQDIWITSGYALRRLIGILGVSLPVLICLDLFIVNNYNNTLPSISHYYFTRASSILVTILSLLAIFLIVYKGKSPIDFILSFIAGISAFLIILFPTDNLCTISNPASICVTVLPVSDTRVSLHYISAGLFLTCLAYMSFFLFTRSNKSIAARGPKKIIRNRIYRACGLIMISCILIIFLGQNDLIVSRTFYEKNHLTFWLEIVALESFGFTWLIKGETLFKD